MRYFKKVFLTIFDPISSFISNSFPEKAYKILNKSLLVQVTIALIITIAIFFMR